MSALQPAVYPVGLPVGPASSAEPPPLGALSPAAPATGTEPPVQGSELPTSGQLDAPPTRNKARVRSHDADVHDQGNSFSAAVLASFAGDADTM
jgi:hypothetical protein